VRRDAPDPRTKLSLAEMEPQSRTICAHVLGPRAWALIFLGHRCRLRGDPSHLPGCSADGVSWLTG